MGLSPAAYRSLTSQRPTLLHTGGRGTRSRYGGGLPPGSSSAATQANSQGQRPYTTTATRAGSSR